MAEVGVRIIEDANEAEFQHCNTHHVKSRSRREGQKRVQWPRATENNKWAQFDIIVATVLENTLAGGVDRKLGLDETDRPLNPPGPQVAFDMA